MVLIVDGCRRANSVHHIDAELEYLLSLPRMKEEADRFSGDVRHVSDGADLLYVHQGEMAIISTCDVPDTVRLPRMLASDDATSCVIIALQSAVCEVIGHLDHPYGVKSFFTRITPLMSSVRSPSPVHVHLVGAFPDAKDTGRATLGHIVTHLLTSDTLEYVLKTFCVAGLNVDRPDQPNAQCKVTGLLFDRMKADAYAAKIAWEARGPAPALRLARLQSSDRSAVTEVFDTISGTLQIRPFTYDLLLPFNPTELTLEEMKRLSTTPEQEPITFFEGLRAALTLMFRYPDPSKTWFAEGSLQFTINNNADDGNDSETSHFWVPLGASSTLAMKKATVTELRQK